MDSQDLPKGGALENKKSRKDVFWRLVRFSRPEFFRIFCGLTGLTVNSVTNLYFPWMMGNILDNSSKASDISDILISSVGIIAVGSIASWVRVYCLGTSGRLLSGRLRVQVFDSYIDRDIHFFDSSKIGELVTVIEKDVDTAASALTDKLAAGLRAMNSAVNGSWLLFKTSPQLCGITLSLLPLVGAAAMYLNRKAKRLAEKLRNVQSDALSFAIERFNNVSTIRLNAKESAEKNTFNGYMETCNTLSRSSYISDGAFMGFLNLATNFSLVVVLLAGGKMIAKNQLSAGSLTRFAIQSAFVGLGFSGLSAFYSDFTRALDAASRLVSC
jgi:ATP-binding cassette subfamily B (MDR/TAP) protein 8